MQAPTTPDPSTAACPTPDGARHLGRTRLRRLTRSQFNHTVRDLLGTATSPASALAPDERIGPFYSNAIAPITDLLVLQHSEISAALATEAVSRTDQLTGCDLAANASCAAEFVERFGLRAFRRPLTATERDEYLALFQEERARSDAAGAFSLVVETFLNSPFFLYHTDHTTNAPTDLPVALTSYEIASRLSYFLWDTMPDAELFTLAQSDALLDAPTLDAQVARMLADPRAGDSVPAFHLQWLGIDDVEAVDKDEARFPGFTPALLTAMREETTRFVDFVIRGGDGLMSTLFTAPFSFPGSSLLPIYGVAAPVGFQAGSRVALDPAERAGLLTQPAFLARHAHRDQTSPVHRGIAVRENILCQPLASPPANVNNVAPPVSPATTTRQRFAAHVADPSCAGCHRLIDPIGLGFENYDPIGAYRTIDGPAAVDASGELSGAGDAVAGPFVGAVELSHKLAKSSVAEQCLSSQWFRYALGRMESTDDACTLQQIQSAFRSSGGDVRRLIAEIVRSDAFRYARSNGGAR